MTHQWLWIKNEDLTRTNEFINDSVNQRSHSWTWGMKMWILCYYYFSFGIFSYKNKKISFDQNKDTSKNSDIPLFLWS